MKEGDILVLDRGFRDTKEKLEQENFKALMPALKGKGKQLFTDESNESRFVTKIRWPVESVHGPLKQNYHLLNHIFDDKLIPKIGSYFRIASFLNNTFGKRLQSDILQRIHNQKKCVEYFGYWGRKNGMSSLKTSFQKCYTR